ncbi:MAG: hypothetical protein EOM26_11340 [Alphaproteobacteria bacterium]|nr:hypothetical protein [Alphaproteobacteria bacterium]
MFSRLDPVFRTTLRHTEQTDARLGIREEDARDDPRKKKSRRDANSEESEREDLAIVSIPALRAFLTGMLEDPEAARAKAEQHAAGAAARNPQASRAAKAYQATASGGTPADYTAATGGERLAALTEQEKTTIRALIDTLCWLESQEVFELSIGKTSESLLAGLVEAATRTKAEIGG